MIKLTEPQIVLLRAQFSIIVECEPETLALEGNVLASGNDEEDARAEEDIRTQLNSGNEWAWCYVRVIAAWKGYEGQDCLGGCSYKSRKDFIEAGDYFPDMVQAAFQNLVTVIESDLDSLGELLAVQS